MNAATLKGLKGLKAESYSTYKNYPSHAFLSWVFPGADLIKVLGSVFIIAMVFCLQSLQSLQHKPPQLACPHELVGALYAALVQAEDNPLDVQLPGNCGNKALHGGGQADGVKP